MLSSPNSCLTLLTISVIYVLFPLSAFPCTIHWRNLTFDISLCFFIILIWSSTKFSTFFWSFENVIFNFLCWGIVNGLSLWLDKNISTSLMFGKYNPDSFQLWEISFSLWPIVSPFTKYLVHSSLRLKFVVNRHLLQIVLLYYFQEWFRILY